MSDSNSSVGGKPEERELLRVALDAVAARSYSLMAQRLKAESPYVKLHPSSFTSFVMTYFYNVHFERDIDALVAEFFDSKSFLTRQIEEAGNPENALELMKKATETIEKMNLKRMKLEAKGKVKAKAQPTND
jgi:hypothetical protein